MRKRKHSPEFRERAVKQTLTGDESIKDIAAGLGISYWTLQDWRREYLESQKNEPETRKKSSAEEELKRLRAEVASLRMDNTKVCSHAFPGRLKKFAFMKAWRKDFSVNRMAALLGVSKSGFYSYMKRSGKKKEVVSSDLLSMITQIHRSNRRCFGLRKICHELKGLGLQYSRLSVIRGMKILEISGKRRKRYVPRTTDSDHDSPISPNLLNRNFSTESPNQAWVSDITYVRTATGWLYLCAIIDLYSRKVVGWSMKRHMESSLVASALRMAIGSRCPASGLVFHSDRGSQYASQELRSELKKHGIVQSMSRKGNCWDNAVAESFFGQMKNELDRKVFANQEEAKCEIFDYIEVFYNRKRSHSYLGYLSPEAFETKKVA